MKQWEGHDEEEGAKEQVEKPLLVSPCHQISIFDILPLANSSIWSFPVIQRFLKSNFILTYQARQARQAYHQSLRPHPCVIIKQSWPPFCLYLQLSTFFAILGNFSLSLFLIVSQCFTCFPFAGPGSKSSGLPMVTSELFSYWKCWPSCSIILCFYWWWYPDV